MAKGRKTEVGSIPAGVGMGLLIAVIASLLSAGAFSALIQNGTVQEDVSGIWAIVTLAISALLGCLLAARSVGQKYAVISAVTAGAFGFILLGCGILFFNEPFHGLGRNLLSVLVGGATASVFSLRKSDKRRKVKVHAH